MSSYTIKMLFALLAIRLAVQIYGKREKLYVKKFRQPSSDAFVQREVNSLMECSAMCLLSKHINFQAFECDIEENICRLYDSPLATAEDCPIEYYFNPHSQTCLRYIDQKVTWEAARNFCLANGEDLVTLDSLSSAHWLTKVIVTAPGLRQKRIWIGGRKEGSTWFWKGKQVDPIELDYWAVSNPSGDGNCLNLLSKQDFKMNDESCETTCQFFCEGVNFVYI
ncbi:snaclec stejaggregin-B subunit beta-1-like [Watersipora subatra]|uniref:snaclec stejaggregin-B subunit beta-1-like n=1 Tax=Watersipora subatra TaxID=2589382 RepID=UPI00355C4B28